MNTRKIPTSVPALIAFAAGCLAGARKYGAVLLLAQNTAARVGADFVDLVGEAGPNPAIRGREATWQLTREELAASRAILRHAKAAARDYWSDVVDLLKIHLGRTWNAAWEAAGFTRFTLGTSRGEPLPMLLRIRSYLRDHAAHENAPLNITAAQTEVHIAAIETAEHAVAVANAACKKAAVDRLASIQRLRRRLTGLRQELEQLLEATDLRWHEFGFRRPVDPRTPDRVQKVTATPGLPGQVVVTHGGAPRAVGYRVSWRVKDSDAAPTVAGLFADRTVNLSGLPSGAHVAVSVTARNEAGETRPVEVMVLVT